MGILRRGRYVKGKKIGKAPIVVVVRAAGLKAAVPLLCHCFALLTEFLPLNLMC